VSQPQARIRQRADFAPRLCEHLCALPGVARVHWRLRKNAKRRDFLRMTVVREPWAHPTVILSISQYRFYLGEPIDWRFRSPTRKAPLA